MLFFKNAKNKTKQKNMDGKKGNLFLTIYL